MDGEEKCPGIAPGKGAIPNGDVSSPIIQHSNCREATPPPTASRRVSCSSNGSSSLSCATPDYDSGNYSGSNTSEFIFQPGISCSSEEEAHLGLEVRSLRSQLERLCKSERWYKNELKVQKRSKLDLLEKLYVNERKFMRENQKLQADCKRLYALCNEIEGKKSEEKDELIKRLKSLEKVIEASKDRIFHKTPAVESLEFELQRQKELVEEHEHLIKTLRSQKQKLLEDLRGLNKDCDAKLLEIEKKTIALECENRTITKRCLELAKCNAQLEQNFLCSEKNDNEIANLRQTSQKQQVEINRLTAAIAEYKSAYDDEVQHLTQQLEDANSALNGYSQELTSIKTSYTENQLQNEHLKSEIQQYKKMRESYEKYITVLQGNSAELDSKCMEIEHLESVIEIQAAQLAELNKNNEDSIQHWKQVANALQEELDAKNHELKMKQQQFMDAHNKHTDENRKLRERLSQLEGLNEKLLSQLRNSSVEITKKSSEIEQLKGIARDLNDLNVENSQLKKLLEVKDEELSQSKVHDAFVSELQKETQKLKDDLRNQIIKRTEMDSLMIKQKELEELVNNKEKKNKELKQKLDKTEDERNKIEGNFKILIEELKQKNKSIEQQHKNHLSAIQSHSETLNNLQIENEHLKSQLSQQTRIQSELEISRDLIKQYEAQKLLLISNSSHPNDDSLHQVVITNPVYSQNETNEIPNQLLRETSQKVPEICDSSCQVNICNVKLANSASSSICPAKEAFQIRELKLMQRVLEAEHRKHIARYEIHIRTLLGKLRSYRNRDSKEKSREVVECEKQIQVLREQLRLALRRSSEIEHYKKINLQLTSNLQSLTDDYKRMLLSTASQTPPISKLLNYDDYYKLIAKSNNYVPNLNALTDSIDALKEDISQMKATLGGSIEHSTPKPYLYLPVKRLSLMDELKYADDNFKF